MHCHCGTNNRAPRWTFTDTCKPDVRTGAREESASPAWLAAHAMNARDITKVYIWRLDTGCGPTNICVFNAYLLFKEWNGRQGAKVKHVNVRVALATQLIGSFRSGQCQWISVCSLPGLVSDSNQHKLVMLAHRWGEVNWLFNVTINNILGIYVTAHRGAGGLKKLDLRSSSQRHRRFAGFFNVPVQAPTRD